MNMNANISKTDTLVRTIAVDSLLVLTICAIPAVSHLLAFPLYKLNPMLIALTVGMAMVADRRNAFLLAVLMPLTSMLFTGMPVIANAVCMIPELMAVVAVYHVTEKHLPKFVAFVAAAIAGKVVFYSLRALLFAPAALIGTNLLVQLAVIVAAALVFVGIKRIVKN